MAETKEQKMIFFKKNTLSQGPTPDGVVALRAEIKKGWKTERKKNHTHKLSQGLTPEEAEALMLEITGLKSQLDQSKESQVKKKNVNTHTQIVSGNLAR
jgi:hypothetical protein